MTPSAPDPAPVGPGGLVRVAVEVAPFHLDRPFDYLVPDDMELAVGHRVQVVFAGRRVRGLVVDTATDTEVPAARLRAVRVKLGEHRWVRPDELEVLRWAASRFGAPLADVVRHALPGRTVDVERRAASAGWYPPGAAPRPSSDPPPDAATLEAAWAHYEDGDELLAQVRGGSGTWLLRPLPGEDLAARLGELAQLTLAGDRDVLVIVPDPASPTADAVLEAAGDLAVDVRGGPKARALYRAWLEARCGRARVVVGQLGAAFMPLDRLGLAVVLDESNPALKARSSPRHHAREVVFERARRAGAVGLAIATVPSAVGWRLLRDRRVTPIVPVREAERRARPRVQVVTMDDQPRARLSREAIRALREATRAGAYGVVVAARRGQGRALVCADCGERLRCPRCASSVAVDDAGERPSSGGRLGVRCEGCGWQVRGVPACPACRGREVVPLAAGAARLGTELRRALDVEVAVLEGYGRVAPPPPAILVTTRGSVLDAPPGRIDAVVFPDLDASLRRPTLDAAEDTLRLACAVAGWTVHGRRDPADSVVIAQTRDPDHHAVAALAAWDIGGFWRAESAIRAPLRFPPHGHAIRLELARGAPEDAVGALRAALPPGDELLGPIPGEERDGFLCKTDDRDGLLTALAPVRATLAKQDVELRVDVDPVDAG
ncbi:MAG: hypothetical protein JJT89_09935 [Nitriliruptoraceae bacterium]|nr:hypothetical protein [Nitriliruptoraceae bacterium]